MCSKWCFCVLAATAVSAQTPNGHIDIPKDAPVSMVSVDWGGSRATARGSAYLVDVHASLTLLNSSQKHIRGVTLEVLAQEVTPGGRGAVKVPSLDVAPRDVFSVHIDETLLSPLGGGATPIVEVRLDGILFDDLTFYGPDKLNSQREMTVWEMEARRDRKYFRTLLESAGRDGLQKAMLASLTRQSETPRTGMLQVVRGRATNVDPEREVQFAFLRMADEPIEPAAGMARVAANEAWAPRFEVRNISKRPVRHVEIGWIVKDQNGNQFLAASLPADLNLAPGQDARVFPDAAIKFPDRISIQSMSGFVSSVQFGDGSYWIPSRSSMEEPELRDVASPSPEEQRLARIYQKKGMDALIQELKKF